MFCTANGNLYRHAGHMSISEIMANSVNFSRPSKGTIPLKVQLASKGDHCLTCNSSSPLELNTTTFESQPKQSTSFPKWATCQVNRLRPRTFHIQNAIHLRRALRGSCMEGEIRVNTW